jgi:hypothetical protein
LSFLCLRLAAVSRLWQIVREGLSSGSIYLETANEDLQLLGSIGQLTLIVILQLGLVPIHVVLLFLLTQKTI